MSGKRYKILAVEDTEEHQILIRAALGSEFDVDLVENGNLARKWIENKDYDLFLLDIVLPDTSGYELCVELQSEQDTANIPIVFLTSKNQTEDMVKGFTLGADDFVTKPFNAEELVARVRSKILKTKKSNKGDAILQTGSLILNTTIHKAFVDNDGKKEEVFLTPTEFRLLYFLVKQNGEVLTREQLMDYTWGENLNVTTRNVDTHVSKLRKKLGDLGKNITSIHGVGYRYSGEYAENKVA